MASSPKGLRLIKAFDCLKSKPNFDCSVVLNKLKVQLASDGELKGSFTIEPMMCNLGGTLHGGYIASVVDVVSFYSPLSSPNGKISWTTTLNVTYIKSAKQGDIVNVQTKLLSQGSSPIIETYFHGGDGSLLAKGTATFVTGTEKFQEMFKFISGFDVHEQ